MSGKLSRALIILLCLIFFAALSPIAFAEDEVAPVKVIFSCEDESALPGLHVFDQDGVEYAPMTDADSGEVQYGSFLLMPGDYSYSFHDEAGRYEDTSGSTIISPALMHFIPLDLTLNIEVQSFSFTYINPVYINEITEEDIPEPIISEEELLNESRRLVEQITGIGNRRKTSFNSDSGTVYTDMQSAAAELRTQLDSRKTTAVIRITPSENITTLEQFKDFSKNLFYAAIPHTGNPTDGDYVRYEFGGFDAEGSITSSPVYILTITYTPLFYTTVEQESALDAEVTRILASLSLESKSDYQKISTIYDYLCRNVTYDYAHLNDKEYTLKHTAYAALINHTAVCQGYATAFYRLCLTVDVDTRIITSTSMNHAWNIVALGGQYYELDATWDRNKTPETYEFFLKGSEYWLSNHKLNNISTIGDEYSVTPTTLLAAEFAAAYPLSYSNAAAPLTVSFDSGGGSSIAAQFLISGDLLIPPADPVRDGYWFTGWYSNTSFETLFDFDTAVTADTTLYARWAVPDLVLPAALIEIEEEAFRDGAFSFAVLPENAVTVGPLAFADCDDLLFIYIPASVEDIDSTAFGSLTGLTILGTPSITPSTAESFAATHGYAFVPISR